jgi:hypothetical protein
MSALIAWLRFVFSLIFAAVLRNQNPGTVGTVTFCLSGTGTVINYGSGYGYGYSSDSGTATVIKFLNHKSSHRHNIKLCI